MGGIISFAKKYFAETTLHGFRYLTEASSLLERILWVWFISMAFTFASFMVRSNLRNAKDNPITVSIETIPVQDLPFPAVTLNAAKLPYPYRLAEAVYNDVKIDCLRFYPWHGETGTCQECIDDTRDFRRDLSTHISEMLYHQYDFYFDACLSELETTENLEKTLEIMGRSLKKDCETHNTQSQVTAIKAVHACLHNLTNDYDYEFYESIRVITDMLERSFRVPECMVEDIFKESLESCFWNRDIVSDGDCKQQIDELTGDVKEIFCWANGILKTVIPRERTSEYKGGIAFKTAWRCGRDYFLNQDLGNDALNILNALPEELENIFLPNCTYAEILLKNPRLSECSQMIQDDFWLDKMELVYKFKKQTIAPYSRIAYEKSELKDIDKIKEVLETEKNYKLINNSNKFTVNEYATILGCKFGNHDLTDECDLFSNTFTSTGMGYTFNAQPFWTMFENTTSNFAFYKEMYEKENGFDDELPRRILNAGQAFSFEFYIRHAPYGYQYRGDLGYILTPHPKDVLLSLHDPGHFPNLRSEGVIIKPGLSYEIRISPTLTVTDESALTLDNMTRNCLSKDENDGQKLFKHYSQSACIFECKLKQAIKACNCSSWQFPRIDTSASLCLDYESFYMDENYVIDNDCFHGMMHDDSLEANCDCLNDCEQIVYDFDMHVSTLQREVDIDIGSLAMRYDYLKYLEGYRGSEHGADQKDPWLKELSKVQITVQRRLATKITRSKSYSFSSQLANLGGIIGLFTGMSILSLAETVYWILKYIKHMLCSRQHRLVYEPTNHLLHH